jgi:hypothetical protein
MEEHRGQAGEIHADNFLAFAFTDIINIIHSRQQPSCWDHALINTVRPGGTDRQPLGCHARWRYCNEVEMVVKNRQTGFWYRLSRAALQDGIRQFCHAVCISSCSRFPEGVGITSNSVIYLPVVLKTFSSFP